MDKDSTDRKELAEVSAAKSIVWEVLEQLIDEESLIDPYDGGTITIADRVVEELLKRGVLIPEWFPDPSIGDKPAQGYYPTATQLEQWEGRKVTPARVTGR